MMGTSNCTSSCANRARELFSAAPAESRDEKVWRIFGVSEETAPTVENGPILRSFPTSGLTGSNSEDCYTFEGLASTPDVIHTAYYYHYKRTTFGLKEEA